MSTISKKVHRRKLRALRNHIRDKIRDILNSRFVGQGIPITKSKVENYNFDEETGIITMDLLVVPFVPQISFKVVVDQHEVNFVNDK